MMRCIRKVLRFQGDTGIGTEDLTLSAYSIQRISRIDLKTRGGSIHIHPSAGIHIEQQGGMGQGFVTLTDHKTMIEPPGQFQLRVRLR